MATKEELKKELGAINLREVEIKRELSEKHGIEFNKFSVEETDEVGSIISISGTTAQLGELFIMAMHYHPELASTLFAVNSIVEGFWLNRMKLMGYNKHGVDIGEATRDFKKSVLLGDAVAEFISNERKVNDLLGNEDDLI